MLLIHFRTCQILLTVYLRNRFFTLLPSLKKKILIQLGSSSCAMGSNLFSHSIRFSSRSLIYYTVRPQDTRPQAARILLVHVFELGPKKFELNEFMWWKPWETCFFLSTCQAARILSCMSFFFPKKTCISRPYVVLWADCLEESDQIGFIGLLFFHCFQIIWHLISKFSFG